MAKFLIAAAVVVLIAAATDKPVTGRLFYLDAKGRVLSSNPDGSDPKVVFEGRTGGPDGIAIDLPAKHIYWTNMVAMSADDGSVARTGLDGKDFTLIVPV